MTKYRIKKEAVPYINEKFITKIMDYEEWSSIGIDKNALEEVEEAYITFGHESNGKINLTSLSGWGESGSKFYFTIHYPSTKYNEHDKFCKGKLLRTMMDKIQYQLNRFMEENIEEPISK